MQEKGAISIHTENIFPIIKKFLYSDHEIFLRELVSNAIDATQKLVSLASMGEYNGDLGDTKVSVSFNKEAKTITVSDNGIGMTGEEIKKYINQIAFSGATEFVEKYKDKDPEDLIGHFGLGFYSSFMVSEKVRIITKSYKDETEAVEWVCDGSTEYEILPAVRKERGTDIILHVAEDSEEFLDSLRLRGILKKYCKFLPHEVALENEVISNPKPLWTQSPSELTDEDYLKFYKELYPEAPEDPLFWIHLNVDYPFNLTGVLYFPKVKNDLVPSKEKIQLYSRQVFITDEVKEIVPEFLMLLHGVIDSPDIPLNVSRSYLQSDSNVKKINNYITKKVAEKLQALFKEDRKAYEEKWDNIGLFVKFGMISEDKFYDRASKAALLTDIDNKKYTFEEYKELTSANQTDKEERLIWLYASDVDKQHTYINSAQKLSYNILQFDGVLDSHFINRLEQKVEKLSIRRVDAETADKLIDKDEKRESVLSEEESNKAKEIFEKIAGIHTVEAAPLPTDELPVTVTFPEFIRRMQEVAQTSGFGRYMGDAPNQYNVTVNTNHALIAKILKEEDETQREQLAKQALDLAMLSQNMLNGKDLSSFIERSISMVM